MCQKIKPGDLEEAILKELREYSDEVAEGIQEAAIETAKECVKEIKAKSPKKTGKYRRNWKYRIVYRSKNDIRIEVYNAKHYQLTHLLENGHAKRDGGRVAGHPHIGPAEKNAVKSMEGKAKVVIKNGAG